MTKNFTYQEKQNGSTLSATEWNNLAQDVSNAVDAINSGSVGSSTVTVDTAGVVSVNSKGNTTISATKHVNIEPAYVANGGEGTYGDVQIKPGDDITLESHHRSLDKRDEITIKTSNGQDGAAKAPVKLQIISADMTLSSKGKTGNDSNVTNVNVTTGNGKGYLKVRAQAIDLRCEEHGGIALQPKGEDGQNHMNKIKFEHGGGDGLEFGTFNTEKTSIFTDEYRFNKNGVWKMATRQKELSDKADENDSTTTYKYIKQSDDFYDMISQNDEQCTTRDIIKTAAALNGNPSIHTKITNAGNLEIATSLKYKFEFESDEIPSSGTWYYADHLVIGESLILETDPITNISSVKDNLYLSVSDITSSFQFYQSVEEANQMSLQPATPVFDGTETIYLWFGTSEDAIMGCWKLVPQPIPNIKIDSAGELKLGGILDFGSQFNFGETDNGIQTQIKLTKKNNLKNCGVFKVVAVNNHASQSMTAQKSFVDYTDPLNPILDDSITTIAPGNSETIAEASLFDIIQLTNYMKANHQGPWTPQP